MEPRKGAERRLASRPKTASAALALVVLVLLIVSGCGGDSDPETASTTAPPAQQAGKGDPTASAPAAGKAGEADAKDKSPSKSQGQKGAGATQGSSVPLPAGEEGRERGPTPREEAEATVADMTLTSPALIGPEGILPREHTCEGKDSSPPLQWAGTPEGSEELVLFAMNSQPVEGKLFFDWAVAGIDPGLTQIEAARPPAGTTVGRNGFGRNAYSICPAPGSSETFIFALFALPQELSPSKGFDPAQLRREVLEVSGNVGLLAASYRR